MLQDAAKYGRVIWILNSNQWLERKRGYYMTDWNERAEILRAFQEIYSVEPVDDLEGTVSEALLRIKPHYFGNGGPSTRENTPESKLCDQLGIKLIFGLGGEKIYDSAEIVDRVVLSIIKKLEKWR
jgi:D-beta-D-heptose 7-phosphate kinase/D-beta-D-heptose 1-phosphate adenosyltransferase